MRAAMLVVAVLSAVVACAPAPPRAPAPALAGSRAPIIIAHRGASGHRPEHTLAAYDLAIDMGADYVEPDVVATRDGVLVVRHENEIGGTTDAAARFPDRRTVKVVDGDTVVGWFVEDLTLAELRTLRARERLPFRSHAWDGYFPVPTLEEVLALVGRRSREIGRSIGVYPELKHPTYFRAAGLPLEERLVAALARVGLDRADAPVFVQSFEPGALRRMRALSPVRRVQLVAAEGAPYDWASAGDPRASAWMATPDGLAAVAGWAHGVAVEKRLVQPVGADGALLAETGLVADAHRAGLVVHVWTLRADSAFLPAAYRGDPVAEWQHFAALGVDGMFGDFPDDGVRALRPARPDR